MSSFDIANQLLIKEALRRLMAAAQSERAPMPADSPARAFYLGVEAAAQDSLHPERADAKPADWLEQEPPMFREGYARTSVLVSTAMIADRAMLELPLPEFDVVS
jgi:hypothetical protein